ncbi:hypothetical protein [uncultured Aureimonas sp.]|uniref:tetratricopeptide repeat protein n=1 Tax=uncultured Aureimonas sp. TaxID=1604662 RepID=UPI0025CF7BD1|nr:hypothetical protein [uncultured Aureimonas sp.]
MSVLAQTKINPPADWQAFERASAVLWQEILGDRRLKRFGRGGQDQYGLDMVGYEDRDPAKLVGIQCKCKGQGQAVTEAELRKGFDRAIGYLPNLSEYVLTTTAPDDSSIEGVALKITEEQRKLGRKVLVRVMGWDSLQSEIQRSVDALYAFDPTHSAFGARMLEGLDMLRDGQERSGADMVAGFGEMGVLVTSGFDRLSAQVATNTALDATRQVAQALEAHLDAEIDGYRDRELNGGRPLTALGRLEELWGRLPADCSDRIRFRVRTLIGHCYLRLDDEDRGAAELMAAAEYAAEDPKALANKILALTVLRRFPEAVELGADCLAKDPSDETVAAYVVQAASMAGEADPVTRIPEPLRDSDIVRRHMLAHHRARGDGVTWRGLAREARQRDPDDDQYVRVAAEADLSDVIEAFDRGEWALAEGMRSSLQKAAHDLARLWEKEAATEERETEDALALCHNAAAAALGWGDTTNAARIVREGLAIAPDNASLLLKAAIVAHETSDVEWARDVFPKLGNTGHQLLVKAQIASSLGEYVFLSQLGESDLVTLPAAERPVVDVLVEVAKTKVVPVDGKDAIVLVERMRSGPGRLSVRAMVMVSRLADFLSLPGEAEGAFEDAMAMVKDDTHQADRIMLARLAQGRGDLFSVVQLLSGRLGDRADAESRLLLASAYAYVQPPLEGGPEAFDELPSDLRDTDAVLHLEGAMHFNRGDVEAAERCFRSLAGRHPNEVDPVTKVAQCLLRSGRGSRIASLLQGMEPGMVEGEPSDRMTFAQLLLRARRPDDALELGYRTLRSNRHDPDINARWVGLAFAAGLERVAGAVRLAGVDTWVECTNVDGGVRAYLIEDGTDRPAEGVVSPAHPFARAVTGNGVGHRYALDAPFGQGDTWTLTKVMHGRLHAFHDVSENFEARFPEHRGFWRFRAQGDNIEPVLEVIRQRGEQRDRVFEAYASGRLPMKVWASAPGDSISFAATLAATGRDVDTCLGLGGERQFALGAIRRGRRRGAVLDTLCAWTVLDLDAMDILRSLFPRLLVPRSTIDELQAMRDEAGGDHKGGGIASFLNGRFHFEERTAEGHRNAARTLDQFLGTLDRYCEPIVAHAPVSLERHVHSALSSMGFGIMDAALVAREKGMLHLTEDRASRAIGHSLLEAEGAWLQVVFMVARNRGHIDGQRYARLVAGLAARRHAHVAIDPETVVELARDPDPAYRDGVALLGRYIGTPNADFRSHLRVVLGSLRRLWSGGQCDLAAMRATSSLLDAIARYPALRVETLPEFIVAQTQGLPKLQAYVQAWARGHFLVG